MLAVSLTLPSDSIRQKVLDHLKNFYNTQPVEKIYIHTDKPYYILGERVWLKAYLVNGINHQYTAPSKHLHIDLFSPKGDLVNTITLRNSSGGAAGDFDLRDAIGDGTYILRAYTNSMQNFPDHFTFQKEIQVFAPKESKHDPKTSNSETFDIQFFPEGGNLVNGIPSKVGFKAVGVDGNGIDIEGSVVDESRQFVAAIKTLKFGLGFFNISPMSGKSYTAEITHQGITKEFAIPKALEDGYTLSYLPPRHGTCKVILRSSQPSGLHNTLLHGHLRGSSFVAEYIQTEGNQAVIEISLDSVADGVAHLTLFDPGGLPVCERLIYINNPPQYHLSAATDQASYANRDKVQLNLQLESEHKSSNLEEAELSVSITDQSLVREFANGLDIRSYLLLTSELRGRIEQPSYYFDPANRSAGVLLDVLLLSQGWRRFNWDEILSTKAKMVDFLPEESFTISGQITKIGDSSKPLKAKVFFNTMDNSFLFGETVTRDDGKFAFTGLTFTDTTAVIIKANRYRESKKNKENNDHKSSNSAGSRQVAIQLDKPTLPSLSAESAVRVQSTPLETINKLIKTQQKIFSVDSIYRDFTVDLDAVTVKARKMEKEDAFNQTAQLYSRPDARLILDSLGPVAQAYTTVFDLIQSRFAGVQVTGTYPNQQAIIRGNSSITGSNSAVFVLDGVIISGDGVNDIVVPDIAYIDVLKSGATAAIYGAHAANGVIAIYTKKGERAPAYSGPRIGLIDFEHPGYYQARTFYQPNYDQKLPEHVKPDFRTTLYWNPSVYTDKDGSVRLEFYTDDKKSMYHIDVQGMTKDGTPLSATSNFKVD